MIKRAPFATALVLLLLVSAIAFGQTAQVGTLSGQIKDQTGGALPGVSVEAKHEEKGLTRTATTDSSGRFRMPAVPLGNYTVTAKLSGFDTATSRHNVVENEKTTDLSISMKIGATSEAIIVSAEVPVVDKTNVAVRSNFRVEEFQKIPVGRSYQSLMGLAPGIPGTGGGNVNAHGALTGNNQFLFDGVDTTDPTTGTFGSNLNFEAVQEVALYTAGLSAEYGRSIGAIVNVITKSGGNTISGSGKYLATNDDWNSQNKTKDERCATASPPAACTTLGASLARTKFDHVNPVDSFTLGGPFWRDHVWFFGAYEKAKATGAQQQTPVTRENFQQTTVSPFWDARVTGQLTPSQSVWARRHVAPTNGFIINYGNPAELFAYTRQDQSGNSTAAQYTGIFGATTSVEVFAAKQGNVITVFPNGQSALTNSAPHFSLADNFYYNGSFFDGFVDRPRKQFIAAVSLFETFLGRTHDLKAGYDLQTVKSGALFTFQSNQLFLDNSFDPVTRNFAPSSRRDYDPPAPSTSKGRISAFYVRDKFNIMPRLFTEIGVRFEKQTGKSDLGAATVDATTWSPRFSASYDLRGDGRSLIVGSYARPYQFINQGFSDSFALIPQKANYTNFTWDGTKYVQGAHVVQGAGSLPTNTDLKPTYIDEVTFGYQRQVGITMGAGIRGIWRKWGDLIDDVIDWNSDGTLAQKVVNYSPAKHNYRGVELTFEKRFSRNWYANVNYTWSRVRGNHFGDAFTTLGDFGASNCRTAVDPTVGTNGVLPCSEVNNGANKDGTPNFDFPNDLKAQGTYLFHIGPVSLTTALAGEYRSNLSYTPNISMSVLLPGTTTNSGSTATYFYEKRGSRRLPNTYGLDGSMEATYRIWKNAEVGFKGEVFNLTDHQDKTLVNLTSYCANANAAAGSTCKVNRDRFGSATARGSFRGPRNYRLTTLVRF